MQKLAVTSTIKQTDTRIVFISHMSDYFLKKLMILMKKISITCIHKTHTMYQIQNLTKQSPVYGFKHSFQSSPKWTTSQ